MTEKCRHISTSTSLAGGTRCDSCHLLLAKKPCRKRPTDTDRLDALMRWIRQAHPISEHWTRAKIDRQLREEAKRG